MTTLKATKLLNSFEKKAVKKHNVDAIKYIGVIRLKIFNLALKGEELNELQAKAILRIKDRI